MKTCLRFTLPAAVLALLVSALRAADPATPATESRREKRIVVASDAEAGAAAARNERRLEFRRAAPATRATETIPFLGVETGPMDPTLNAQLGVAPGTGLVVRLVLPDASASEVLAEHDVLLKLNEQILIDTHQLAVLIRNMKAGEEVTLSYLRAGKMATAKVTLAEHQVPKQGDVMFFAGGMPAPMAWSASAPAVAALPGSDANDLLWMMDVGRTGGPRSVVNRRIGTDRTVSVTVNTGDGTMNYSDEQGTLEVVTKEGKRSLTAKGRDGTVVFSGPIDTPEEKAKLPEDVRERLDKIEDMRDFQFHTDPGFEGGETKILRPLGQGVNLIRPKVQEGLRRLDTL